MERVVYLDFVAIPIFIFILLASFVRKMTDGPSNRIFILLVLNSLITTVCDVVSGVVASHSPLSNFEVFTVFVAEEMYDIFHPLTLVFTLLLLFAETRIWYWITQKKRLVLTFIPYFGILLVCIINLFTNFVFSVDPDYGYIRGDGIFIIYTISAVYFLWGIIYIIRRREMFSKKRVFAFCSVYFVNIAAIIFQLIFPKYLIEMIMMALAELFVSLLVLRPEDYVDSATGFPIYNAYVNEIRKIGMSTMSKKIIVMRLINAKQLRKYFGEEKYRSFLKNILTSIRGYLENQRIFFDIYFEAPGSIYMLLDTYDFDFEAVVHDIYADFMAGIVGVESRGANIIPRFCEIRYPYDTMDPDTVLNIGHQFHHVIPFDQFYTRANTFLDTYNFRINNNIDKILTRAIINNKFEMYYQPIYSVKDKKFLSAEALIRLNDEEFGFISPGLFIPAAERMGLMNPIGDFVLESVFSFISSEDFYCLGMDYIELNLSVAQCIQSNLSDKIFALGKKYYVNPDRVNLEITETTYENIGGVVDQNIKTLSEYGFSFSLDDYGTGYSNMHRISRIPLNIIKIDKTMVDDMTNDSGMSVMRNTIAMIKDIDKEIVC
ncbi:MAG: EAL domain-containing protein, partial [Ruminiclostridium sp.]|nr:EAL domain-containing protein [Ruminiclostridium sp.]